VLLHFGPAARQNRATVFFRIILVIPQVFVLYFLNLAVYVVVIIGWFAALFTGQLPDWAGEFITGGVRWNTRVLAYEFLLTGQYPPFSLEPEPGFPVDVATRPGRLNRLAVLFRIFIGIPAGIVLGLLFLGMQIFGIITWIATLVRGSQPPLIYEANAAAIRYGARYYGFMGMVTSTYPAQVLGDGEAVPVGAGTASPASPPVYGDTVGMPQPAPTTDPWSLRLTSGARRLVGVFMVLGVLYLVGVGALIGVLAANTSNQNAAITAQNELVTAYNLVSNQASSFTRTAQQCASAGTPASAFACQKQADASFQQDLETYAQTLDDIDFPSAVSSQAQSARAAATQAANVMSQLQSATNAQDYLRLVTSLNLQAKLQAVDTTSRALNSALLQQ
jgi:hypothetical protein